MKGFPGLAILAAVAWPAQAAESSAILVLDDKTYEFGEVSAFRIRDQGDATKYKTYVLFTSTAPDREAIVHARDPYSAAINDPATQGPSVAFFVDEEGTISMNAHIEGVQYLDSTGKIMFQPGSMRGGCQENTEEHVACTVETPEPVDTANGKQWTVRASFDTEVLKRPAGRPVEAGGGEAGEALLALEKALQGDDLNAILAHLSEDQAYDYSAGWRSPEESLEDAKETLGRFLPSRLEVVGGEYVEDGVVELEVKGVFPGSEDGVLYSVIMVREGDRWGFSRSRLLGFLD